MHHIRIQDQPAPTSSVSAGSSFQIYYSATNDSSTETPSGGHKDYVAIVGPGDTNVFERWFEQEQVAAGAGYGVFLDVTGVSAGDYLISVSLDPDSGSHEQGSATFTVS